MLDALQTEGFYTPEAAEPLPEEAEAPPNPAEEAQPEPMEEAPEAKKTDLPPDEAEAPSDEDEALPEPIPEAPPEEAEALPEETEAPPDGAETLSEPEQRERMVIQMPLDGFPPEKIDNLCKLVASKASLIKKAIGVEALPIDYSLTTIDFPWVPEGAQSNEIMAYAQLVSKLCDMAKTQQRILAVEHPVENEKYAFRCFLCDKFDYIFIDEYQDTQSPVVDIFLTHIKPKAQGRLCIGFFGDKMQSIYDTGVGNIDAFVASGDVQEIVKEDNYRCATTVITLLNNIRNDIKQKAAKTNSDGVLINKTGSAVFVYSTGDFSLDSFRTNDLVAGWDFDDPKRTKVLFLTHRLIARRIGFAELLQAFRPTDRLIGNDPDKLASHLLKIGEILYFYERKNYAAVIKSIHKKIKTNTDKKAIGTVLAGILSDASQTIETVINKLDQECLLRKDERLEGYIEKHPDVFDKVKILPLLQLRAYYDYYNEFSAYSTQHGIKGAEFDNVLVIMENGGWNNYNFRYYFEKTAGKESIVARTERIFYVCCSRAIENLIIYYPSPTPQTISQAKRLFGDANVVSL